MHCLVTHLTLEDYIFLGYDTVFFGNLLLSFIDKLSVSIFWVTEGHVLQITKH
jgi:hypothetical protein